MRYLVFAFLSLCLLAGCEKSSDNAFSANASGQGGSMARFTVVNNYLYAVDQASLKVFDINDPSKPVLVKTVPVGFEIETIFPFKDRLFIGSTSIIHIFSIADPANPLKLSEAISPTVMRRCDPVVAKDTVAFATLRTNGECGGTTSVLAVFDIKDIAHPVQKAAYNVSEPYGLGYKDSTLYVCDKMMDLMVFNIARPYTPTFIKNVTEQDADYYDVIPYGDVLVCWTSRGITLYNISQPQNPQLIKSIF